MQTKLLIMNAREDYSHAIDLLQSLRVRANQISIDDLMYAYILAKDWCNWSCNPYSPSNLIRSKDIDIPTVSYRFQQLAEYCEQELERREAELLIYFLHINPELSSLLNSSNETVKSLAQNHIHAMVVTAEFFSSKLSKAYYKEILENNSIPYAELL